MINKFFNFLYSIFSPYPNLRSHIVNCFDISINFFNSPATLIVKSGLSTENKISGLNLIISLTVWLILLLILNILKKYL